MADIPNPAQTVAPAPSISLTINGQAVDVSDRGDNLLDTLRSNGLTSVKDGCSPQGQCGCCTVLVDGQPRVACVTPTRRVRGRSITTLEGLDAERRSGWANAFCQTGGSQCGFCTPGIIMRLDGITEADALDNALLAHLCRCTGWQTVREAWDVMQGETPVSLGGSAGDVERDFEMASKRATIEGRAPQRVAPEIALGDGGFIADTAPADALIAVRSSAGLAQWAVAETLTAARLAAGKVQGRRTTVDHGWPLTVPDGDWDATLRTTWVEPAYLETDAAWCSPGQEPQAVVANGGSFGGKDAAGDPELAAAARALATEHGRPVLAVASREEVTRSGAKRPPVAGGAKLLADGSVAVELNVARTPGLADVIASAAEAVPGLSVEVVEHDVAGPPTSSALRAAGWAEVLVLAAGASGVVGSQGVVTSPEGATAQAEVVVDDDGRVETILVTVDAGPPLDEAALRSYCIGAAHMAWSWLTSEALTVDATGVVHDLTVRSFGVLRAIDTPQIEVTIMDSGASQAPVNGSEAVFAAVAAEGWLTLGRQQDWPVGLPA